MESGEGGDDGVRRRVGPVGSCREGWHLRERGGSTPLRSGKGVARKGRAFR